MLKIGIIGCGKIADQHAINIQRTAKGEILSACDTELLMAEQFAGRFQVPYHYADVTEMLNSISLDVVHITTPPASHLPLAKLCIDAGCHVYVEKPFTLDTAETVELLDYASKRNKLVTVGHNLQFTHASNRLRQLIHKGYLGGDPIHMESYYCYDLRIPKYAMSVLGDDNHWVRKLPGKLLHNLISHGISKIAEYIDDDNPEVQVLGFPSRTMHAINQKDIIDEVRVTIKSSKGATAYFTCSTQFKPALRSFRIYGPSNAIALDEDQQMLFKLRGNRHKSLLNFFVPSFIGVHQNISNLFFNAWKFIRNDLHADHGMRHLMDSFYSAVKLKSEPPIPYNQIILVSHLLDTIFHQLYHNR